MQYVRLIKEMNIEQIEDIQSTNYKGSISTRSLHLSLSAILLAFGECVQLEIDVGDRHSAR